MLFRHTSNPPNRHTARILAIRGNFQLAGKKFMAGLYAPAPAPWGTGKGARRGGGGGQKDKLDLTA